jgi:hypothetical protein
MIPCLKHNVDVREKYIYETSKINVRLAVVFIATQYTSLPNLKPHYPKRFWHL